VKIVLASNSPRRRELLALGGLPFTVRVCQVDETPLVGEAPREYVLRLATEKAHAAAMTLAEAAMIIAADTTVADGEQILGKPVDPADALRMLRQLCNRTHQVYTALAILEAESGALLTDLCQTETPMRSYNDAEIQAYVATGDPLDKAGAYAIQHAGFHPVERMQGCFANVMGLPLCHLARNLERLGLRFAADLPQACQQNLDYACPVYPAILDWRG
jgi:MAF protein